MKSFGLEVFDGADALSQAELRPEVADPVDVGGDVGARDAEAGNYVGRHPSRLGVLVEDRDAHAREGQVVGAGEPGRPRADDGYAAFEGGVAPRGFRRDRRGLGARELDGANVDRALVVVAAAGVLTDVVAERARDERQRVVGEDRCEGLLRGALGLQPDVFGNLLLDGTGFYAGRREAVVKGKVLCICGPARFPSEAVLG